MRLACVLLVGLSTSAWAQTPAEVDFAEKRIRPLLIAKCVECHGPTKQTLGLRLDTRQGMVKGGENGPAIVPGKPDESLLIQAVRQNGDLKMPPKSKLTKQEIADLEAWVKAGAVLPVIGVTANDDARRKHWAFQPVVQPAIPVGQAENPIDRFIQARLREKNLSPALPADRISLIRRAAFDLTGLPPTPEEVAAFVNDRQAGAFDRVVDRLLASPRYGERAARLWLDVARFADTKGYVFFQDANYPWAHTYRDYVIDAFNADIGYDRFVLEQLAADQLPGASKPALRALGFVTLGGRFMNNIHDILDDQIDVVARGLMGLTVTCARCHDHKFDPITQQDYYALYGVFASCAEPEVPPLFETPVRTRVYEAFRAELDRREQKLNEFVQAQFKAVTTGARQRVAEYWLAVHAQGDQPVQENFMLLADGSDINPTMLTRWRAQLARSRRKHDPVLAPWHALAQLPERSFAVAAREMIARWTNAPDPAKPVNPLILFALAAKPPATIAEAAKIYADVLNTVDRIWLDALKADPNRTSLGEPALEQVRQVFHAAGSAPRLPRGQIDDLELFPDRPGQGKLQELRKSVEQWRISGVGAPARAHALVDRPEPYEPHVFLRGSPNQPGPAVPRRMPGILSAGSLEPFRNGSGRLELARAIVAPRNPLTARVFVNRVWQQHFGQGLVRTPADFGLRSDPPTHPELLDHLAGEFMRDGWSIKRLHRRIMLSQTYQQSSTGDGPALAGDPENRWLARMPRRRLDFESLRDAMLSVSKRLDEQLGGPSTRDLLGSGVRRRTMYGFVDRLQVPGLLRSFDFPSPDATSAQRDTTTIPQQALFLMNSPFAADCARGLAQRPDVAGVADPGERLRRLYRLCFGRTPDGPELAVALEATRAGGPAWERFAQALLASNEFTFLD